MINVLKFESKKWNNQDAIVKINMNFQKQWTRKNIWISQVAIQKNTIWFQSLVQWLLFLKMDWIVQDKEKLSTSIFFSWKYSFC